MDICLTKREARKRSPMCRLTGKRTSCSTQDLCISSTQTVQITVCKLKPHFSAKPRYIAICQNMQLKINSTIYFLQLKFSN